MVNDSADNSKQMIKIRIKIILNKFLFSKRKNDKAYCYFTVFEVFVFRNSFLKKD